MKKIFLVFILVLPITMYGQVSKLNLVFNNSLDKDSTCYRLCITNMADTVVNEWVYTDVDKELDSLTPGTYKIQLSKCSDPAEGSITKSTKLYANRTTEVTFELFYDETHSEIDEETRKEIIKDREEILYNLSYLNTNWVEKSTSLKFNANAGFTVYKWFSFSKHVGFLAGFGFGFGHYGFVKDTTFMKVSPSRKIYEYYNYLDGHTDIKLRLTFKSQQKEYYPDPMAFIDVGAIYYAPVAFRHIARYDNNSKIVERSLHQFTDVRGYINVGILPFSFFAEYRSLDFLIGNYPEFPKYNVGIKLSIVP